MTDTDRARLELARRAWLFWNGKEQEVEAGVRRVARRLRVQSRSATSRRALTLVPVALALFAALAYGQTGGFERPPAFATRWFGGFGHGEASRRLDDGVYPRKLADSVERVEHGVRELAKSPAAPRAMPVDPADLPQDALEPEPAPRAPAKAPRARRAPRPEASSSDAPKTASASWRDIDEALAENDEVTARRLLQGLANGAEDATTQAKARLGLAQLSVSRGDCKRATKIAERVARSEGIDEKLVRRAHDIVLRCQ
jgi:hypothetical protein